MNLPILLTAFLLGRIGDFSRVTLTTAYLVGIPLMFGVRNLVQTIIDGRIRRGQLLFAQRIPGGVVPER